MLSTIQNIAVFVSGTGSNFKAMLTAGVPVALVLADRPCVALLLAKEKGIHSILLERKEFSASFDREAYTARVLETLQEYRIDLVAMAGFMTILSDSLFETYEGRILNTHPSLLPLFKGDHAVLDALGAGATETGCTIHIATPALDDGPILVQKSVPVLPGDTVETLHERIKEVERVLYPVVLKEILSGIRTLPSH